MSRENAKFLAPRLAHTIAQLVKVRKFPSPFMISTITGSKTDASHRLGPILLIGHRGAGKSTLGRLTAAALGRQFIDLDHKLEQRRGTPIDEQLHDLRSFRAHEAQLLDQLSKISPPPLIACGAGVERLPEDAFIVWIDREDWRDEVKKSARPRVRPELSLEQEWAWMQAERHPRWIEAAHLRLPIPRGRTQEQSAKELTTLLRWAMAAKDSPIAARTFFVPLHTADRARAERDARRLGLGGVELRSDIFPTRPTNKLDAPFIASLRTPDPTWLTGFQDAQAWDVDLQLLDALPDGGPPHLILSLHPQRVDRADLDSLFQAAATFSDRYIILKYAPRVRSWTELEHFFEHLTALRRAQIPFTALPQTRFAWTRPILALENQTNYLPVGLHLRDDAHPSALDLQDFLPHLAGPYPTVFDALLGDPVATSQGDLWHRRRALEDGEEALSYLKIPVKSGELDQALPILTKLPIRGLSITSPLKKEAAQSPLVSTDLSAINTLKRGQPWTGTDTDETGMEQTLAHIEARGVGPGRALIFGRGGVTPALRRALLKRRWHIVAHISARQGFNEDHHAIKALDLIINAGGPQGGRSPFAPPCTLWLDLNYSHVEPAPTGSIHLQGDLFFDAQARAQRTFWSS